MTHPDYIDADGPEVEVPDTRAGYEGGPATRQCKVLRTARTDRGSRGISVVLYPDGRTGYVYTDKLR